MQRGRGGTLSYTVFAVLLHSQAVPASAQYFGRQKVQYEDFEWQVL